MRGYVYPFGNGATIGRIDQGQDFGGTGPIYAIGAARIIRTGAPGWPGGAGVLYRLLAGPDRGRYVYVNEGIAPSVRAGQVVAAGQKIGALIPGTSTGIEIGWANANGEPTSHGEYTEGKETVGGKAMERLLEALRGTGSSSSRNGFEKSLIAQGKSQAEAQKIAEGEGLKSGLGDVIPNPSEVVSTVAGEVISGLENLLGEKAVPIMLNIGLLGGGAFLAYFGVARMVGVDHPVKTPIGAAAKAGAVAGAA